MPTVDSEVLPVLARVPRPTSTGRVTPPPSQTHTARSSVHFFSCQAWFTANARCRSSPANAARRTRPRCSATVRASITRAVKRPASIACVENSSRGTGEDTLCRHEECQKCGQGVDMHFLFFFMTVHHASAEPLFESEAPREMGDYLWSRGDQCEGARYMLQTLAVPRCSVVSEAVFTKALASLSCIS